VTQSLQARRGRLPAPWLVPALLVAAVAGCRSDRITVQPPPPDTHPPQIQILSPTDTSYDLNADGLLDVSVAWSDSGGRVNPATATVRSLGPLIGTADTSTNLVRAWQVVRLDSVGLLLRETIADLLPDGRNRLEVSVADTAGNRFTDTVTFDLPHAAFSRTIETGLATAISSYDIVTDSAGHRGYMTTGQTLVVFDADSLRIVALIPSMGSNRLASVVLDEPRGAAYVAEGRVERYGLRTNAYQGDVPGTYSTAGLSRSRANSQVVYTGEDFAGYLGYVDVVADIRIDDMPIPHPYSLEEFVPTMAVLANDTKLYMARYSQGGILVVDPRSKQIVRHVDTAGNGPFNSGSFALSRDDRHLYLALTDGDPRGVADLDTFSDSIVRILDLSQWVPVGIQLSPSQRRLFLTTIPRDTLVPSLNFLIDVQRWAVLQFFNQPKAPGVLRVDGPIAFRPDGKLIFVARNQVIDVYINREMNR